MSMIDWIATPFRLAEAASSPERLQINQLSEQLRAEQDTNLLLEESLADAELALEDAGWMRLTASLQNEFTRAGIRRAAEVCRAVAVVNPLIKRGLSLRIGYVWGGGVSISARATGQETGEQDVNAVVQAFLDDDSNKRSFTGQQAREEAERALGTDGQLCLALFTNPRTGRVQVRSIPFDEVDDVITNPDDRDEPWFYKRTWTQTTVDQQTGMTAATTRTVYYPALGYYPRTRLRRIDGNEVLWDAPLLHVRVNALDGWQWGVPDAYSAVFWARGYKEFLEDWARLVKALSRFAWRATVPGSKSKAVQRRLAQLPARDPISGEPQMAGATAVMTGDMGLEAIPKAGATIDSDSGRPLAAMVASGLDVPVTMLLGDPGQTGARAVAETLDEPTRNAMALRRELWSEVHRSILGYVVDQAVIAPQGKLKGTISRDDDDRRIVMLAGDDDGSQRTVEVAWPEFDDVPVNVLVTAISQADQTGKVPPLTTARLLLEALGVDDVDEVLDEMTDEQGRFVSPDASAGQAAVDAFRRGEDPASTLDGSNQPANQPPDDGGADDQAA